MTSTSPGQVSHRNTPPSQHKHRKTQKGSCRAGKKHAFQLPTHATSHETTDRRLDCGVLLFVYILKLLLAFLYVYFLFFMIFLFYTYIFLDIFLCIFTSYFVSIFYFFIILYISKILVLFRLGNKLR